jgi:predicted transcriptional regulator
MAQTPVEMTKDLTLTLIKTGRLSADVMQDTLQKTYTTLIALKVREEMATTTGAPVSETSPMDWRKSITKPAVTCLECGQSFKQLSLRHLMMHGLNGRSYRAKYGIPRTQPLAAKTTTARRQQVIRETRPWEKTLMYLKGQEHNGHVSPEPEAKVRRDETEEPSVAAPAQPKRQRNTTQKKQSARKKSSQG